MSVIKKYLLYLVRWQLSTPILAVCVVSLHYLGTTWATVIANLIGGLIFFWVDRWIFQRTAVLQGELWEAKNQVRCADCGKLERGLRLVKAIGYDKTNDKEPEFRCKSCSEMKYINDYINRIHDD